MYSVFLVEDEVLIREGIRTLIDWKEHGFQFVGEAPDGELAWPQIQKLKPDIVITDIKMPFMDGLSLSRLIKKELPDTTVIILSGHDDFSYAKEAISIGVSEYLLKPLSKDQLVKALEEVREHRDKEGEQQRYLSQFKQEMQEYLTNSRRGFLDLLVSGKQPATVLLERGAKLGLDLAAERYNVVLFLMEEEDLEPGYSAILADLQRDLSASFPADEHVVMFGLGVDIMVFLIKGDAADIGALTEGCVSTIRDLCAPLEGTVGWSLVVGEPAARLSEVADCYRAARKQLFHREAAQTGGQAPDTFDPNDLDPSQMDQRTLNKFLSSGLAEDVNGFVDDFFDSLGASAVQSFLFRQYIALNVQFAVSAFLSDLGLSKSELRLPDAAALTKLLATLDGAKEYLRSLLSQALALRDRAATSRYGNILKNALSYLREHFSDQDVSLNTMAKLSNVSATYFSAVFSQQMGKTFVEYLTGLRMEKARELLRCTDKSSGDIAYEVGYSDPHYFSFLFKKVNGCTPRDYRAGGKQT